MSSAMLLPPVFWFRWKFACPRVESTPAPEGRMWSLPGPSTLPAPSGLDGKEPWWTLAVGWGAKGLALALDVDDPRGPAPFDPDTPHLSDGLQVWIDTRDTRDVHRATRYCHRFIVRAVPDRAGKNVTPRIEQVKIHRAVADAPIAPAGLVAGRAGKRKGGWWLDLHFPAEALHGYDPETNPRLGFTYCLMSESKGDQFLTVGRDFPVGEDPSLWCSLQLKPGEGPAPEAVTAATPARKRKKKDEG
jgi:hypothetical protein